MKKLSHKIVKLLIKKNLKISFAESCTGGLLSSVITSISGSSKIFTFGMVAYSNQTKINNLKVPKNIIRNAVNFWEYSTPKNTGSVIILFILSEKGLPFAAFS